MDVKRRKQDFLLGLAAIVFLALFIVTVLFLAQPRAGPTRTVVVHFYHEAGLAPLKKGSQVLLSGAIRVGEVTDVQVRQVAPADNHGAAPRTVVEAVAEIDQSLPLYGNCEITSDMPLIGGTGTMVISNVGTPGIPLPAGPIEGLPPQGLAAITAISRRLTAEGGLIDRLDTMLDPQAEGSLLNKIVISVDDINALTAELRLQLSPAQQQTLLSKIHVILDDLNATTSSVRQQMTLDGGTTMLAKLHATLDVLHADLATVNSVLAENQPVLRDTLASVAHAARTVDEDIVGQLRNELDPRNADSLVGQLHTVLRGVDSAVVNLEVLTQEGSNLVVANGPQIEQILEYVRETARNLRDGSRDVMLNPSRLIWGPPAAQQEKLGAFTAARDFAEAATNLDQAAARMQALLRATPADDQLEQTRRQVREVSQALEQAFQRFQQAEEYFWNEMK